MTSLRVLGCALALLAWAASASAQTVPAGGGSSFVGSSCITISSGTISIPATCNPTLAGMTISGTITGTPTWASGQTFPSLTVNSATGTTGVIFSVQSNATTIGSYTARTDTSGSWKFVYGTSGSDNFQIFRAGTAAWELNGNDTNWRPATNNASDLGTTGLLVRTVYVGTSVITPKTAYTAFVIANIATAIPNNGDVGYCSDCTIANPCAGGGSGAIAKRLNGTNVCN